MAIEMTHQELLQDFRDFAVTASSADELMEYICQNLHEKLIRYNWVGFYIVNDEQDALRVGPFVGSFSHPGDGPGARIPFSEGLCGAAATSRESVVVNDVTKDPRYVAGSNMVKSEIVVPIFAGDSFAAELDVNSYFENSFDKPEQEFVESCAAIVGNYMQKQRTAHLNSLAMSLAN